MMDQNAIKAFEEAMRSAFAEADRFAIEELIFEPVHSAKVSEALIAA